MMAKTQGLGQGWWPIWKVAEYFSCSDDHVRALVNQGQLEAIKFGKRALRVSVISMKGFEEKMKIQSTEKV